MAGFPKTGLASIGVVVALLGGLAIAVPAFTTEKTTDIAKIGDLKLTAKEATWHVIPAFVGPGAVAAGMILIGAAFVSRRSS